MNVARTSHKFEKRREARQSKTRAGSVLAHVTKRVAAITPPRALVVLRFLLNNPKNTLCSWLKFPTCSHPISYVRSVETGEIFGAAAYRGRHIVGLLILMLGPSLANGKIALTEDSAWEKTGRFLYHEAVDEFGDLLASGAGGTSDLKFGLALNLINRQPKTQANLDRAERLFSEVYSAEGMEGLGIASKYYSGRIKEVHQRKAELAEAEEIYAQIIAANPRHFFAQLAATRYALIRFYSVESLEERRSRFLELEALADNLIRPSVRSHFHSLMGDLAARYEISLEKSLYHYREAVAAGIQNFRIRRDVLVSIGEIARELGDVPVAVEYYERFLREFPRDTRRVLIKERLVALQTQLSQIP